MSEEQSRVQRYQALVLRYEQIDAEIDALLEQHGGHSENLSDQDRETYRQLAEQRSDLYNQIKSIEAEWLSEGDEDEP
ncbi:MAG: hypothetical protein HC915_03035 [Anaerolineae bacterium]|nr:hypothetical protein [Anaerolineae bacterium]